MDPRKRHNALRRLVFISVCCLSVFVVSGAKEASSSNTESTTTSWFSSDIPSIKTHSSILESKIKYGEEEVKEMASRRHLNGPGSSPPRCVSKCESCTPCKPVLKIVTSPDPGAGYYPQVWRCKCGDKLYNP